MHIVEPQVFLVAQTRVNEEQLLDYLALIGAEDWGSTAVSDVEEIIEVGGRVCYNSFIPGLNPNVIRTRKTNKDHIENLLEAGHGSVLEHAMVTFIFHDVSRVFTHELVRHRIGVAISQESLRYVRLTELGVWVPSCIRSSPEALAAFTEAITQAEQNYHRLEQILMPNPDGMGFEEKKMITSALRRVAPIGLATNMQWSANMRTLRHVIEERTSPAAEEEIRLVFGKVAEICQKEFPILFADYQMEMVDGLPCYQTKNRKV